VTPSLMVTEAFWVGKAFEQPRQVRSSMGCDRLEHSITESFILQHTDKIHHSESRD
jgi:hypothetical protein